MFHARPPYFATQKCQHLSRPNMSNQRALVVLVQDQLSAFLRQHYGLLAVDLLNEKRQVEAELQGEAIGLGICVLCNFAHGVV